MAATYDGMLVTFYANGVQVGTLFDSGTDIVRVQYGSYNKYAIGSDSWWRSLEHKFGAGYIDEVKVWNFALSAAQVKLNE